MKLLNPSAAILACAALSVANANELGRAQTIQSASHQAQANSQSRVDKSAEKTLVLNAEIEQLQEEVRNLEIYRDHLAALVASQNAEVASLDQQINDIAKTRQGVVPLMYQMLAELKVSIEQDRPIKIDSRLQRLDKLQAMMHRADVADAEKFRRILEAYQIEMDYGTKLGVYQGQVALDDKTIEADLFYLGRIAFVARSLSGEQFWHWQADKKRWVALDSSFKPQLDQAFAVAAQQVAPSLLELPLSITAHATTQP
ncbi:DUF3450 domain-containing protein [Vibrio sp. SM6]|uniref:DUF3450 domain-containing protein n=1 Tax=Vibrio agarilyticus TaxID=2726741 RepID=A0A7X8TNK7_9VIBR|nr:DUF3450 domain-containing protein [Vibrio agarilyticus]NLS12072.1 DUF3450 domain-containing protein [Vibrio agarilyticus]